jgi:hypothetical protein
VPRFSFSINFLYYRVVVFLRHLPTETKSVLFTSSASDCDLTCMSGCSFSTAQVMFMSLFFSCCKSFLSHVFSSSYFHAFYSLIPVIITLFSHFHSCSLCKYIWLCSMTLNFSSKFYIFMDSQLSNSMEKSPRETDIHSACHEICYFLCNSVLLNPILSRRMQSTSSYATSLIPCSNI